MLHYYAAGVLVLVFLRTADVLRSELSSECCSVETSPDFVECVGDRYTCGAIVTANSGVE